MYKTRLPRLIIPVCAILAVVVAAGLPVFADEIPARWQAEWPKTDFSRSNVDFSEIISGGPPKDGIPAIDEPKFEKVAEVDDLKPTEPVIVLKIGNRAKAYPVRILMWHEIANDEINGVPVVVTYCPLCNAAVVFDRRVGDNVLDFGVSGKLRNSDMIMYDRQTESWWQQFVGLGIVGEMTDVKLTRLPSGLEPFGEFKRKHPNGLVLKANNPLARRYGQNPYVNYDSAAKPFLYSGDYDGPGKPLSYVLAVGKDAWLLEDLKKAGTIEHGDLVVRWHEGMNSALDSRQIDEGRDIGFLSVRKKTGNSFKDVPYDLTFGFVFKAFHPDGVIHSVK